MHRNYLLQVCIVVSLHIVKCDIKTEKSPDLNFCAAELKNYERACQKYL